MFYYKIVQLLCKKNHSLIISYTKQCQIYVSTKFYFILYLPYHFSESITELFEKESTQNDTLKR